MHHIHQAKIETKREKRREQKTSKIANVLHYRDASLTFLHHTYIKESREISVALDKESTL